MRITPTVFLDGRTGITILIENITEVTRQEKALRESEENFRKIFHESPIGIVLYSLDGKLKGDQ